jgi:hypothetical protein
MALTALASLCLLPRATTRMQPPAFDTPTLFVTTVCFHSCATHTTMVVLIMRTLWLRWWCLNPLLLFSPRHALLHSTHALSIAALACVHLHSTLRLFILVHTHNRHSHLSLQQLLNKPFILVHTHNRHSHLSLQAAAQQALHTCAHPQPSLSLVVAAAAQQAMRIHARLSITSDAATPTSTVHVSLVHTHNRHSHLSLQQLLNKPCASTLGFQSLQMQPRPLRLSMYLMLINLVHPHSMHQPLQMQ